MSRLIYDILKPSQPNFQHTLREWEDRAGRAGHDIRLTSDIRARSKKAVEELGLDSNDTKASELYFALQGRASEDNDWLARYFGIGRQDSPEVCLRKILSWLEKNHLPTAWVCKAPVIKTALKNHPPKILMKSLGLRSAESMLKRNNPAELLPLSLCMEPSSWRAKLRLDYKKYKPNDFDETKISVHIVSSDRAAKLASHGLQKSRVVIQCYETGSIVLIPPKTRFNMDVLAITTSLLEAVTEIRRSSAYYRTISVRKDFGLQFYAACELGLVKASSKLSHVGWNSLHRYLMRDKAIFSRLEQPHLTKEDIEISNSVDSLSDLDPRFEYWGGLDYVFFGKSLERPVSLHLVDVVTNASNRLSYSESSVAYGRARLWDELWSRYLAEEATAENVIDRFLGDDGGIV